MSASCLEPLLEGSNSELDPPEHVVDSEGSGKASANGSSATLSATAAAVNAI